MRGRLHNKAGMWESEEQHRERLRQVDIPLFFQYDLQNYLRKHKEAKVLIIFDTFEALNENVIEKKHRSKNERWVQEIIE